MPGGAREAGSPDAGPLAAGLGSGRPGRGGGDGCPGHGQRAVRDGGRRRRPGRAGHRLPPGQAGPVVRDPRRRPAGGRPLARTLGLAAPVHPGRLQRPAGLGLPRPRLALPHQGRGGRLPGGLRGPVPAAGPVRGGRGRAHPPGRPVPGGRRGTPLRGRQRGRGLRRLPHPAGPRLRRRAGPGHPAAPLQRLPAPLPAAGGPGAGGRRGQLGRRDRPRDLRGQEDLAVGPAPGQRADQRREPAGPAARPRRSGSSSPAC